MITKKIFYPNADPESTSVDGHVLRYHSGDSWNDLTTGNGTSADDSSSDMYLTWFRSTAVSNQWLYLYRSILAFDTSVIQADSTISQATLSIYGRDKFDNGGWLPNLNVYTITGTPTTSLSDSDYQTFNSTACSTAITYSNWSITGYNNFTLNATGIAAINKGGITRFGVRNANYDAANSTPTWASTKYALITGWTADRGIGYKPKLTVTYTSSSTVLPGKDLSSLEALRNIELSCMGRFYIDESGNACYESRNVRNP